MTKQLKKEKESTKCNQKATTLSMYFQSSSGKCWKGSQIIVENSAKKNEEGVAIEECHKREDIEREMLDHDINHFAKVYQSRAFKDKIYKNLCKDHARNNIPIGNMCPHDFSNENVYEFFKLLQNTQSNSSQY